jgi:hypothetical protein
VIATPARTIGVVLLGGVAVGSALLLLHPPVAGAYPICPFKALTGLDCPFCGGMRAVASLLHGNIAAAADYNLLVAIGVPAAVLFAVVAVGRGPRAQPMVDAVFSNRGSMVLLSVSLGFLLLRLLPAAHWLTSTG